MIVLKNSGIVFNNDAHTYHLDDKQLQGITGMIGRQLFPNKYSDIPDFILQRAANIGTEIHQNLHTSDMFETEHFEYQTNYLKLKIDLGLDIIDNEYLVTDYKHFASAIDKVGLINDKLGLIDVKTTYKLDLEYLSWQLSIYKHLFNLVNPDIEISFLSAIHVDKKTNEVTYHEVEEKPKNEVKKLLECEVNGLNYDNPEILTIPDDRIGLIIESITEIETQAKELEAQKKKLRSEIEKAFEAQNVTKWETDSFVISRRKGYTREGFDKNTFKSDNPELFEKYKTEIEVKGSIITKLK